MRIAILHTSAAAAPYTPTGRMAQDLARGLTERGHEVTLVGAPGDLESLPGVELVRARRPPRIRGLDWYEGEIDAAPGVVWHVLRGSYDVAHALDPAHAWALVRAAPLGAPRTILSLTRTPERRYLVGRRHRLEMLKTSIAKCAAVAVPNEEAAALARRYLLVDPTVLKPGLVLERWNVQADRADAPTVVCGSGATLPESARDQVLAAFELVRRRRPDARLLMAEPPTRGVHPSAEEGVLWPHARSRDELAALLAAAWVAVAWDRGDATALGAIEALAAGTPAVVPAPLAASVFGRARVGSRFDAGSPNALADAMEEALDLATEPRIARACRDRAQRFAWDSVLPAYEELYRPGSERGAEEPVRLAGGR